MRHRIYAILAATVSCLWILAGCNDNELGIKKKRPNRPPETILASGPPDSTRQTPYKVHLFWSGSDPDGTIDHYDYIMVDHPAIDDSIGADTTYAHRVVVSPPAFDDPRWTATTAKDSIFTTVADTLRLPPPPKGGGDLGRRRAPFERWHTFFVRAVDNEGMADLTPSYRSFNSTTIAPTVALKDPPVKPGVVFNGPPVLIFNWEGEDEVGDGTTQKPVASRWIKIQSQFEFPEFPDSLYYLPERYKVAGNGWSPWHRWDALDKSGVQAILKNLQVSEGRFIGYYIFAVQAMDDAGAITPVFDWTTPGRNNVSLIKVSGQIGAVLRVDEHFLGTQTFVVGSRAVSLDVAGGQVISFKWRGNADSYGGEIVAYRYGWDLIDPSNDEEWEQGWSATALTSKSRSFSAGTHRFFVEARDNAGTITRAEYVLTVRQVTRVHDLLLVDDTERSDGLVETYEDGRWAAVIDSIRAVHPFDFDRVRDVYDVVDNRNESPPIQLVFDYKNIVWTVYSGRGRSALFNLAQFFDPFVDRNRNNTVPFNYVNIYLDNKGHLWVSGWRPGHETWKLYDTLLPPGRAVNVTYWDDPIISHSQIDSVGAPSWLFKMGVEAFDVGAGGDAREERRGAEHNCLGMRRGSPQGFETQQFVSSPPSDAGATDHTHSLVIRTADVDVPPAVSLTESTDTQANHFHTVTITLAQFQALARGEHVTVTSSEAANPVPHTHTFDLKDQLGLWGAPPLTVDATRWQFSPAVPGRPNIEIYNMPGFMAVQTPALLDGRSLALYVYVSGVPESNEPQLHFPLTADNQPVFILAKSVGSVNDPAIPYTRALCSFEPYQLQFFSHLRLAEFVLVHHFHLGLADLP